MTPTRVILECTAEGWTWTIHSGGTMVQHTMRLTPTGAKGTTKGTIQTRLEDMGIDESLIYDLAFAIESGDAYELARIMERAKSA